ncbi:MAG TPA: 30S ribosomal protein S6 [Gemmatimonadales bacterium]|jgi:small subunit ribosomal protein S6|nr:30S ribosomal protein S6 [Gemmatimonadales bacterium]
MTRQYEAVYIFDSALEEAAVNEKLERFHALLPQAEGTAIAVDVWGKRTLAYPVSGRETGYYVLTKFAASPEMLPEFERALKLDEGLLRHLVVLDEGAKMAPAPSSKDGEEEE